MTRTLFAILLSLMLVVFIRPVFSQNYEKCKNADGFYDPSCTSKIDRSISEISSNSFNRILDPIEGIWRFSEKLNGAVVWSELKITRIDSDKEHTKFETFNVRTGRTRIINKAAGNTYFGTNVNDKGQTATYEIKFLDINNIQITGIIDQNPNLISARLHRIFPIDFYAHNARYGGSKTTDKQPVTGTGISGTAFFINPDGYLLTNAHVVRDCKNQSKISYYSKDIPAKLIAADDALDLALLKADIKNKNYIKISSKDPEKLQRVIVAGYPLGKELSDDLKLTSGIISSLKGINDNSNRIQIDAALNHGNSGGPIIDEKSGELIGVAVSGLRPDKFSSINFGIKSQSVLTFLKSNKIKEPINLSLFSSSSSNSVLNKLEESVVYTYCLIK